VEDKLKENVSARTHVNTKKTKSNKVIKNQKNAQENDKMPTLMLSNDNKNKTPTQMMSPTNENKSLIPDPNSPGE